ncbi:MAG: hypothetical protein EBT98_10235 [Opitutaceae bacterium]|nr:hypothetical protein [Opitutaceae bacterium]
MMLICIIKHFPYPRAALIIILGFGGTLTAWTTVYLKKNQRAEKNARFHLLADRTIAQVQARFEIYASGLHDAQVVVNAIGEKNITRARFREYVNSRDITHALPGARGLGFSRQVQPADQTDFLNSARADGEPNFTVRQSAPHAGNLSVVQYIEPATPNQAAIGYDLASEENRADAIVTAIRTGAPTLTHPLTLVQAYDKIKEGFLFLQPVYRAEASLNSVEDRERAAVGLVYTPLVIDEVLKDFDLQNGSLSLALFDLDEAAKPKLFYASSGSDELITDGLEKNISLKIFGRSWLAEIKAQPQFTQNLNLINPQKVAGYLLAVTIGLAGIFYLYGGKRRTS